MGFLRILGVCRSLSRSRLPRARALLIPSVSIIYLAHVPRGSCQRQQGAPSSAFSRRPFARPGWRNGHLQRVGTWDRANPHSASRAQSSTTAPGALPVGCQAPEPRFRPDIVLRRRAARTPHHRRPGTPRSTRCAQKYDGIGISNALLVSARAPGRAVSDPSAAEERSKPDRPRVRRLSEGAIHGKRSCRSRRIQQCNGIED